MQQVDYDAIPARDGLAGNGLDPTWHPRPPVTYVYPVKETPVAPKQINVTEAHYSIEVAIHRLGHAAQVKGPPCGTTRRPLRARPAAEAVT